MSCRIIVTGGEMEQQEIDAYIQRAKQKYGKEPLGIDIKIDGEFWSLPTTSEASRFIGFVALLDIWLVHLNASTMESEQKSMIE